MGGFFSLNLNMFSKCKYIVREEISLHDLKVA